MMTKAAVAACIALASLFAASPAAACASTHRVQFEPGSTRLVDGDAIAGLLQIAVHGPRRMVMVSVSAPDGAFARRRADSLADLLASHGLDRRGIYIEASGNGAERANLLIYPPPRRATGAGLAQAPSSPRHPCGG